MPESVVLYNMYGPTEAAVDVSSWRTERHVEGRSEPHPSDVVPIGRPVWNTQLYVLDADFRPTAIGEPVALRPRDVAPVHDGDGDAAEAVPAELRLGDRVDDSKRPGLDRGC